MDNKIVNFPVENMESNRRGFGRGLVRAGELSGDVWAITADLRDSTAVGRFAEEFPERFVDVGVAEQNLVTVASGMAHEGKIVFATSYAAFSPGRNWEQIRTTVCYNDEPVRIVGSHGGLGVGPDGATHQALEDIALMRVLPNMTVVVPVDSLEAEKLVLAAIKHSGPMYIRLARHKTPVFTKEDTPFEIGKAYVYREGADATLIATGPFVYTALETAQLLAQFDLDIEVISAPTVKPLDTRTILLSVKKTGRAITLEDHQIAGGLGGAVAEALSLELPVPLLRLGVDDEFGQSGGDKDLYEAYGLTPRELVKKIRRFFADTGYTERQGL